MRTLMLVLALTLLTAACSGEDTLAHAEDANPGGVPSILGSYVINGIDPLGTQYTGFLTITRDDPLGDYDLQWIVTEGFQEGRGRLDGNQLEVTWHSVADTPFNLNGTATLTVTVKGELYGTKYVDGDDREWQETAYPSEGTNVREPEY